MTQIALTPQRLQITAGTHRAATGDLTGREGHGSTEHAERAPPPVTGRPAAGPVEPLPVPSA